MDDSKLVIDEEFCRICKSSEGGQLDIFGLSGAERNIPTKIRECLPINVGPINYLTDLIARGSRERFQS